MAHKELHTGISGRGETTYLVVVVRDSDGAWLHTHTFDNRAEAECWMRWC